MKITPTALTLNQLLGSANERFVIPSYQRRYSWKSQQLYDLIDDINLLEGTDTHLLGSIVCLTGAHTAGLNMLELVDGQQRLTTISILLECLKEAFVKSGKEERVKELERLLAATPYNGPSVPKIALDTMDSDEFGLHVKTPDPAEDAKFMNERLHDVFWYARDWIAQQKPENLLAFVYKLLNQALVVRLDVSNAKDAFKLFETINNRGLRLSPTDIIKNFVLGNAARFGENQLKDAKGSWSKLMKFLDGTDSDAFFRYFLISKLATRLTKGDVVHEFQSYFMNEVSEAEKLPDRHWYAYEEDSEDEDSAEVEVADEAATKKPKGMPKITFDKFLEGLVNSAKVYGELINQRTGNAKIDRRLRNLRMIKATQAYGFLMYLRANGTGNNAFIEILRLTENFILRRHVCRERANDTERLFARLCEADVENPIPEVLAAYREECPSDEKFRHEFASAEFTSNIIDRARYCLEQLELAKHGDHAELGVLGSDSVHVEHIIPKRINTKKSKDEFGNWPEYLGERVSRLHPKLVHRIGNLTLFAGTLNIVASNNPFSSKKDGYKASSILITKELGQMPNFKFNHLEARSKTLADLAIERWPSP
ncbi:DUF262 domain-containing protein [Rhizobium esperanzae]|uniref:DUF262 domain-containing protein n=1 Tax=Rhizobium esperanzae TaxID=1967781 RepID=A0A7W6W7G6_9HYPH|nr:DUF262 domain-containing protein [Rhizobium esperanzae]MBB4238245.1 hypothetical protein [Rhizobium esperanzae]